MERRRCIARPVRPCTTIAKTAVFVKRKHVARKVPVTTSTTIPTAATAFKVFDRAAHSASAAAQRDHARPVAKAAAVAATGARSGVEAGGTGHAAGEGGPGYLAGAGGGASASGGAGGSAGRGGGGGDAGGVVLACRTKQCVSSCLCRLRCGRGEMCQCGAARGTPALQKQLQAMQGAANSLATKRQRTAALGMQGKASTTRCTCT